MYDLNAEIVLARNVVAYARAEAHRLMRDADRLPVGTQAGRDAARRAEAAILARCDRENDLRWLLARR